MPTPTWDMPVQVEDIVAALSRNANITVSGLAVGSIAPACYNEDAELNPLADQIQVSRLLGAMY